jgi:hypothetical protein
MSSLIIRSPRNIRRLVFALAWGIMEVLDERSDSISYDELLSLGLDRAATYDSTINDKTTSGKETIYEMRRLNIISYEKLGEQTYYRLTSYGQSKLIEINETGIDVTFFTELYNNEIIFKEFVELLKGRQYMGIKDLLEISGMNSPKTSFLKSIVREIPSLIQINPKDKEKYFEYVGFKSLEPSDLKRELIRGYLKIVGNNLFIKIHKLWIHLKNVYLDLEEDIFDEHLLSLAKENIGSVELIQGVLEPGEKILHDPMSNTYYHYVKIKR